MECTINGIGERAGNCALEEVVMAMKVRNDELPCAQTAIQTQHLWPASKLLTEFISFGPQPNKAIVGLNAFAHEAGIHQDGYLKDKSTYEIIDPKSAGIPEGRVGAGEASRAARAAGEVRASASSCRRKSWTWCTTAPSRSRTGKKNVADQEILAILTTLKLSEKMSHRDAAVAGD